MSKLSVNWKITANTNSTQLMNGLPMGYSTAPAINIEHSSDVDFLRPLIPFNGLLDDHLKYLLEVSEQRLLFAGSVLFECGQFDALDYYLLHGELECHFPDGRRETIKSREHRQAVVSAQPRDCNVVATQDCQILTVERERLDKLLAWSQVAEYLLVDIAYNRDLDEDLAWMHTVLKSNLFFKVPPTNVQSIFSCLEARAVEAGEVIIRQGELGDGCYFIKEGQAQVTRQKQGGGREHLADIGIGRCFGEDALLQETVRNATVTMTSDGVLMQLNKRDFLTLLKQPSVAEVTWSRVQSKLFNGSDQDPIDGGAGQSFIAVDVRSEDEYALGHIAGAVNLPLNILRLKSRVLNESKNVHYVLYCNTGRRSTVAAYLLSQLGFNVEVLSGGFSGLEAKALVSVWSTQDYVLKDGKLVSGQ